MLIQFGTPLPPPRVPKLCVGSLLKKIEGFQPKKLFGDPPSQHYADTINLLLTFEILFVLKFTIVGVNVTYVQNKTKTLLFNVSTKIKR